MTAPDLRAYQLDVIASVEREIVAGRRRCCVVAPTGSGTTIIATDLAAKTVTQREHVLICCPPARTHGSDLAEAAYNRRRPRDHPGGIPD